MSAVRGQAACGGSFDPVMLTINRMLSVDVEIGQVEDASVLLSLSADMALESDIGGFDVSAYLTDLGVGDEAEDDEASTPFQFDSDAAAPKFYATSGTPRPSIGEVGAFAIDFDTNRIWGPKQASGWGPARAFVAGEGLGSVVPEQPLTTGDLAVFLTADGNVIGSGGALTATGRSLTSAESPDAARTAIGAVSEDDIVGLAIVFGG